MPTVMEQYEAFVRSNSKAAQCALEFERICATKGWRYVLYGGSARDIILKGEEADPRDLDIVVVGAKRTDLSRAFKLPGKTGFGGCSGKVCGMPVDLWPLQSTWWFSKQPLGRDPTFMDLVKSSAFNLEAIAIEPSKEFFEAGFFECMDKRVLEMLCPEVPYAALFLVRAARFAEKFHLGFGPKLEEYITRIGPTLTLERLMAVQKSYYGGAVVSEERMNELIKPYA